MQNPSPNNHSQCDIYSGARFVPEKAWHKTTTYINAPAVGVRAHPMSYYFVNVPKLPPELSHQRGSVTIVEYAVKENDRVKAGQTLAVVENWWARMAIKAVGSGYISKTFFEPHTHVQEGHPIAIVVCDPEDGPRGEATCAVEVVATIRQKPGRS